MRKYLFLLPILIVPFVFFSSFRTTNDDNSVSNDVNTVSGNEKMDPVDSLKIFPEAVQQIVQNSCFMCHNSGARGDDAKRDLSFDEWNSYSTVTKIAKLHEIQEQINENKMPPPRFLENAPDKKLTDAQKKTVVDWADQETKKLVK